MKVLENQRNNEEEEVSCMSKAKQGHPAVTPDLKSPSRRSSLSTGDGSTIRSDSTYSSSRPYINLNSKESILEEMIKNPRVLVGWQVNIADHGLGTVLATEKNAFRSTVFKVKLETGHEKVLALKRGPKKGSIHFELVRKIN